MKMHLLGGKNFCTADVLADVAKGFVGLVVLFRRFHGVGVVRKTDADEANGKNAGVQALQRLVRSMHLVRVTKSRKIQGKWKFRGHWIRTRLRLMKSHRRRSIN